MLRTLIAGLALTHTPEQVQFYCLDFGGGTLTGAVATCRTSASVATRLEPDRLRRTVAEINTLLAQREELFRRHRVDSMATYRRLLAQRVGTARRLRRRVPRRRRLGHACAQDYEALETAITQIAARGLGYGVHVVLSHPAVDGDAPGAARPASAPSSSCASATRRSPSSTAASPRTCPRAARAAA